jgi:hypothetical protein
VLTPPPLKPLLSPAVPLLSPPLLLTPAVPLLSPAVPVRAPADPALVEVDEEQANAHSKSALQQPRSTKALSLPNVIDFAMVPSPLPKLPSVSVYAFAEDPCAELRR